MIRIVESPEADPPARRSSAEERSGDAERRAWKSAKRFSLENRERYETDGD